MTSLLDNCSVIKEINKVDEVIKASYKRVADLENKLAENTLSSEKQDIIRKELEEVRKLLHTNKDILSKLHGHNRKSFVFALFIVFICLIIYVFLMGIAI